MSNEEDDLQESLEAAQYLVKEALGGITHQDGGNWLGVAKGKLVIALAHLDTVKESLEDKKS